MAIDFCKGLGVQMKFVSVVHPQANDQAGLVNKVIPKGLKKKFDNTKGLWMELVHNILWSYHTTPHYTIKEIVFSLAYGADAMIPMQIDMPLW